MKSIIILIVAILGSIIGLWVGNRDAPTAIISVKIKYIVERLKSCKAIVERILYDAENLRTVYKDLDFKTLPTGRQEYSVDVSVPRSAAQGTARYQVNVSYVCNPIHEMFPIIVANPPISFEVKGPPAPINYLPIPLEEEL